MRNPALPSDLRSPFTSHSATTRLASTLCDFARTSSNVRLMSASSSPPDRPPLAKSQPVALPHHVSSTSSATGPAAITQLTSPPVNGETEDPHTAQQLSTGAVGDDDAAEQGADQSTDNEMDESNSNTPRLPPTLNSQEDLDHVPSTTIPSIGPSTHFYPPDTTFPPGSKIHTLHPREGGIQEQGAGPGLPVQSSPHSAQGLVGGFQATSPSTPSTATSILSQPESLIGAHHQQSLVSSDKAKIVKQAEKRDREGLSRYRETMFGAERNRSSSRGSSERVEKQIEATMPDAGMFHHGQHKILSTLIDCH